MSDTINGLVARQLLAWPHQVNLERVYHDLVLIDPPNGYFAIVEMKLWMSASGNLAGITGDIIKLRNSSLNQFNPKHKIMLIFSANPNTETTIALTYLTDELAKLPAQIGLQNGQNFERETFQTHSDWPIAKQATMDFWVAGIEVS